MVKNYRIVISKDAEKDKEKIKRFPALVDNVDVIIKTLENHPPSADGTLFCERGLGELSQSV